MSPDSIERMASKSLPNEIVFELDKDPKAEGWEETEVDGGLIGYKMPEHINEWFSCAIDIECFALHSALDRLKPNKPVKAIMTQEGDQTKTFCSQAPFHLINEASLRDVRERVYKRHPDLKPEDFEIEAHAYRPNVVIDTGVAWSEDEYQEIRIGQILLRYIGPVGRCAYVYQSWTKTFQENPADEPLTTLRAFRMLKQGFCAFG
jgi:uncharacterized protein YcbX